jgi:hypothetical protein
MASPAPHTTMSEPISKVGLWLRLDGSPECVGIQHPLQAETGVPSRLFAEAPTTGLGVGRFTLSAESTAPRWNAGRASR